MNAVCIPHNPVLWLEFVMKHCLFGVRPVPDATDDELFTGKLCVDQKIRSRQQLITIVASKIVLYRLSMYSPRRIFFFFSYLSI